MAHGLTKFKASELADKAKGAIALIDSAVDGNKGAQDEALQETMKIVLENQISIAETLDLIKKEFDKFEEGLGKIL